MHRGTETHAIGRHGNAEEFLWSSQLWPGNDEWNPAARTNDKVSSHSHGDDTTADAERQQWNDAEWHDEPVSVQEAEPQSAAAKYESVAERSFGGPLGRGNAAVATQY